MKGPSLRLKFEIRRRWECPLCHARVRSSGAETSMTCACAGKEIPPQRMRLIHDGEPMLPWREPIPVAAAAASASEALAAEADIAEAKPVEPLAAQEDREATGSSTDHESELPQSD